MLLIWDFDNWVEYGTIKAKGKHTQQEMLNMLVTSNNLIEHIDED